MAISETKHFRVVIGLSSMDFCYKTVFNRTRAVNL